MRFGVPLAVEVAGMCELARRAEAAGCDSVWVPEHLVWPVEIAPRYPYSDSGRPPVAPDVPTYDAWVLLAWIAAHTGHLKLATSVYILPLRDPHVTARAVATLDLVSGGRAMLGAGVGWMAEEFAIAGQTFEDRGGRAAEIAAILRALWSPGSAAHTGRHYRFPAVHFEPKPPQGERLPILFGGESDVALRRAARHGDGWIGMRHTPESAAARVRELAGLRARFGRAEAPFEVTVGVPSTIDEAAVTAYAEAGVDRICLRPWRPGEDPAPGLERLGELIERAAGHGAAIG
jgi:probable F420-dependent oxidoreductase